VSQAVAREVEPSLGFERVVFFSDAVFAIVITLLVLPLTTEIELPEQSTDIAHDIWRQWPRMLSFGVSFLVIGQFWIAHHRMFNHLRAYDHTLIWLNLVSLLSVCFLPFPTAVLGAHSIDQDRFPVIFYAASMTVTSLCLTVTWLYAATLGRLTRPDLDRHTRRGFTVRSLATTGIFLLSVGAAAFGLYAALAFWLILLPAVRIVLGRRRGRPDDAEAAAGRAM
jgi:TMEM175 potassium channel family protein